MFYIFIQDNKINGAGQCRQLTEGVINFEVSEELYNAFIETPDKYMWSGENLVENPDYEEIIKQKERQRLGLLSLTKREVFLALYKAKGLTPEKVRETITDPAALIEFDYATEYFRGNPLINAIGAQLGYTFDDLDYLFEHGELPNKEDEIIESEEN